MNYWYPQLMKTGGWQHYIIHYNTFLSLCARTHDWISGCNAHSGFCVEISMWRCPKHVFSLLTLPVNKVTQSCQHKIKPLFPKFWPQAYCHLRSIIALEFFSFSSTPNANSLYNFTLRWGAVNSRTSSVLMLVNESNYRERKAISIAPVFAD